jgi:MFS family permease
MQPSLIARPVSSRKQVLVSIYAAAVAFLAYALVYAYRKPFTVANFNGIKYAGISYQTLLIISQVIGYMLSKFVGIRFIAELKRFGRWKVIAILVGIAWLALLAFAFVPPPFGMIFLFINGFPLGFLWGVMFSYVEGRRATDFIGSVMAISFIFSAGITRSVAKWLILQMGVSEQWMPFMTGLLFALPFAFFIFLLERIPPPDEADVAERTERKPMTKEDRKNFLKLFGLGIISVIFTYLFLSVMRDIRDNYMANIWSELGYGNDYGIFTKTETNTSILLLVIMSSLVLVRKNIKAFRIIHFLVLLGFIIAGISSWLFLTGKMPGRIWMQLVSVGLYMGYIPFNCIFFERLIAAFRVKGNVGFLIYVADAFGYLGSVTVMLSKELMNIHIQWSSFYADGVVIASVVGIAGTFVSLVYFNKKFSLLQNK